MNHYLQPCLHFVRKKNMTVLKDQVYPEESRRGPEQIMSLYFGCDVIAEPAGKARQRSSIAKEIWL